MNDGAGADAAILADSGLAQDLRKRRDDRIHADADAGVDGHRIGVLDGDAGQHQFARLGLTQQAVRIRQLDAIIDAQSLARVVDPHGLHAMARASENLRHIGEVIFAGGIVRRQLARVLPEEIGAEAVDAHVGFADGKLLGRAGLLLDDGGDRATGVVNHAAVPGGIFHDGGEQDASGIARGLRMDQAAKRFRAQ